MLKRAQKILSVFLFTLLVVVILGGFYLSMFETPISVEFSPERLMNWVRSLDQWGGAGIIALMVIHSFVPFPAEIVAFIAGEFYGVIWGTVYSWTGAMLGASLAFALSRYLGREFVGALLSDRSRLRLREWSRTESATTLLVVRFIPVIAFNLINYAAGLMHITWWTFLWTTGIGILPLTILFVYLGESMRGSTLSDWLIFIVGAGTLILIFRLFKKYTERRLGLLVQRRDQD